MFLIFMFVCFNMIHVPLPHQIPDSWVTGPIIPKLGPEPMPSIEDDQNAIEMYV